MNNGEGIGMGDILWLNLSHEPLLILHFMIQLKFFKKEKYTNLKKYLPIRANLTLHLSNFIVGETKEIFENEGWEISEISH